jgi:Recombination enhancement, RecA-dependent nuclease
MKTSLNSPTKYEQTRIDAMRRLGCAACAVLGVPNLNHLELHHMLSGGVRMGHYFSMFLCRGHHQGDWSLSQLVWIEPKKRVAISDGRKRFTAVYGTERSLWEKVQTKLKLPQAWPASKILPRRLTTASVWILSVLLCHGGPVERHEVKSCREHNGHRFVEVAPNE